MVGRERRGGRYAASEAAADAWVRTLDERLGHLAEAADIVATADHGMNAKTLCVDLDSVLRGIGHDAEVVRLIRDTHTYHHQNLGGATYVHCDGDVGDTLRVVEGVERVLDRDVAADAFDLPADRLGDYPVLRTPRRCSVRSTRDSRRRDAGSHGSHHEREIPWVRRDADLDEIGGRGRRWLNSDGYRFGIPPASRTASIAPAS